MANLCRVRTTWSGTPVVGAGVSTFYFDEAYSGFVAAVQAFWVAVAARVPAVVTWRTENSGDLIDVATGDLTGTWTDGSGSTVNSSGSGVYAAGCGMRIRWATSGIRNGRRVRGSTFVVPLLGAGYAVDGTIDSTYLTSISNAAGTLRSTTAGNMYIYSRPGPAGAGQRNLVVSHDAPDTVSTLRTRRT